MREFLKISFGSDRAEARSRFEFWAGIEGFDTSMLQADDLRIARMVMRDSPDIFAVELRTRALQEFLASTDAL